MKMITVLTEKGKTMIEYIAQYDYRDDEEIIVITDELIRCKDCKHWYNDGDAITWCNLSKWACGGNGFCLYAERKDDD